ncbi:MAG: hypothetical protein NT001_03430, partial [Candidatus Woesearchaeota archaeon]|nr:hypothetical protein [Candidatus Woesearchaeota archaeon]
MAEGNDTRGGIGKKEIDDVMQKYKERMEKELSGSHSAFRASADKEPGASKDYEDFRKENISPRLTLYEKCCNISENLLKISPDKKKLPEYEESIRICHLNATPSGVASFSILATIAIIVLGSLIGYILFQSPFFIFFFLIAGVAAYIPLNRLPMLFANSWRMKASNQMVLCVFYIVTYMRHTSNL